MGGIWAMHLAYPSPFHFSSDSLDNPFPCPYVRFDRKEEAWDVNRLSSWARSARLSLSLRWRLRNLVGNLVISRLPPSLSSWRRSRGTS